MSHQTGIRADPALLKIFRDVMSGSSATRLLKVNVSEDAESIILTSTKPVVNSWIDDFSCMQSLLVDNEPSYLLYRTDEKSSSTNGYLFIFFAFVPDNAKVREKMLYAASRATLTKELGDFAFKDSMYATTKADLFWDGYRKHCQSKEADTPLTLRESELHAVKLAENGAEIGASSKKSHASGLSVQLDASLEQALLQNWASFSKADEKGGMQQILCLSLNLEKDNQVEMASEQPSSLQSANLIGKDPRYIVIRFQGRDGGHLIFVYVCPAQAPVRQRMIYASCRAGVVDVLQAAPFNLKFDSKLELSDCSELSEAFLESELGLVKNQSTSPPEARHGFVKKKISGPGGGPRRLIK